MTEKKSRNKVVISDAHRAPFIYVEEAPTCGNNGEVIKVTLAAYRDMPAGGGGIATDLVVTAHMRCSIRGAKALRDALDRALLLAAPAVGSNN